MTNNQIINKITAKKYMLGEYASRMDLFAGDDNITNIKMSSMFEACMNEIDRLERTLEVRRQAAKFKAA